MLETYFKLMCDYNYWAHRRVWDCVMQLDEAQFTRELGPDRTSVHAQMAHVVGAEWLWISRLRGLSPDRILTVDDLPTRAAIRARWDAVEADARAFVNELDDEALLAEIDYTTTRGSAQREVCQALLAHLFNHGTDHRAQVLGLIGQLGGPTVEQDMLFYLRERRAS
jgi:uncharacterized damage-inducible protein DinB